MEINTKLIQFLSEGLSAVDGLVRTDIECGGCGIFAQLLSKQLKKVNVDYKIVCLYYDESNTAIKHSKERLTILNNNIQTDCENVIPSHIVVSIYDNTIYLDSTGICNEKAIISKDTIEITDNALDTLVSLEPGENSWNDEFNRNSVPKIEEGFECIFKDFDTFKPHDFINHLKKGRKMYVTKEQ